MKAKPKKFRCGDCGQVFSESELEHKFPNIPDLGARVFPGEVVPGGECPECGALVYQEEN